MLRTLSKLIRFSVHATDIDIGSVKDFYFDDQSWKVRYILIGFGDWLHEKDLLISTVAVGRTGLEAIDTPLSSEQLKNCPSIEIEKGITRKFEELLHEYFSWPFYWEEKFIPGSSICSEVSVGGQCGKKVYLWSFIEVKGYSLNTSDGEAGYIQECIVDDDGWKVRFFVINLRSIFSAKRVLIPPSCIKRISRSVSAFESCISKDKLERAPEYKTTDDITADFERMLLLHYNKQ